MKTFREAIAAGICIGLGGAIYLAVENRMLGAFLFAFGLLTILLYGFKLYTGAIGYAGRVFHALELLVILLGNLVGTAIVGTLLKFTPLAIPDAATALVAKKSAMLAHIFEPHMMLAVFILGIFCGLLMFIGVDCYKNEKLPAPARVIIVFLAVALFILSGFEHCVADMFYFFAATLPAEIPLIHSVTFIGIVVLGNTAGGLCLPRLFLESK